MPPRILRAFAALTASSFALPAPTEAQTPTYAPGQASSVSFGVLPP